MWVLFIFGVTCTIFGIYRIPMAGAIYSGIVGLLFSLFLVYDTQLILGGNKHEIDPEEPLFGAICLYTDIVYIFLALLGMDSD